MVSLLYWDQPHLTQEGVNNINGAIFLIQTQMTFGMVGSVVTVRLHIAHKTYNNSTMHVA